MNDERSFSDRSVIDRAFVVGLLAVAVLAILELQFASFIYSQAQTAFDDRWTQIIFVFRVTTTPLFVLATVWVIASILPHFKVPVARRRYLKEFCWALLGNLLILNFEVFSFLSVPSPYPSGGHIAVEVGQKLVTGLLLSFFLTFLATWSYRRIDSPDEELSIKFGLVTILESALIFVVSYFIVMNIVASAGFFLE